MKNFKKSTGKNLIPKVQEIPEKTLPNKLNVKKIFFWIICGVLSAMILIGIGWFFGHQAMERGI